MMDSHASEFDFELRTNSRQTDLIPMQDRDAAGLAPSPDLPSPLFSIDRSQEAGAPSDLSVINTTGTNELVLTNIFFRTENGC